MKAMKAIFCGILMTTVTLGATVARAGVELNGTGATFPAPIYAKWIDEFGKLHPGVRIDYQSKGSGAGIAAIGRSTC